MKTVNLIPFILLELNEKDQYGFELTKAIETKSNGNIIIKQPTLYTLLKKLEKSKFISSYWQDSEIGGKRHYYKLTENGKLQVSTLPSYSILMQNALEESLEEVPMEVPEEKETKKSFSIMDELLNTQPTESIIPSSEVFAENNIDNNTELDINISNVQVLKDDKLSKDEEFANNKGVMKFTEVIPVPTTPQVIPITPTETNKPTILDHAYEVPKNEDIVKFVDYIDFKNTSNYKYSKKLSLLFLFKSLAVSGSLIIFSIIFNFLTKYTGRSILYYLFLIGSLTIALFYPIIYALNMNKFRIKHQQTEYSIQTKNRLYLGLVGLLIVFLICVIVNISIKNNSIADILKLSNFENFYAPILFYMVYFLDLVYEKLLLRNLKK